MVKAQCWTHKEHSTQPLLLLPAVTGKDACTHWTWNQNSLLEIYTTDELQQMCTAASGEIIIIFQNKRDVESFPKGAVMMYHNLGGLKEHSILSQLG